MNKESRTEKLKKVLLARLHTLSAQMLQEVVGGQAHIGSATGEQAPGGCLKASIRWPAESPAPSAAR